MLQEKAGGNSYCVWDSERLECWLEWGSEKRAVSPSHMRHCHVCHSGCQRDL